MLPIASSTDGAPKTPILTSKPPILTLKPQILTLKPQILTPKPQILTLKPQTQTLSLNPNPNPKLCNDRTGITKQSTVSLRKGALLKTETRIIDGVDDCDRISDRISISDDLGSSVERSMSSPQLFQKNVARSKVYRKASLKVSNDRSDRIEVRRSSMSRICKEKLEGVEPVRIICNPLATPYPYSTGLGISRNIGKNRKEEEEEPKCSHSSCGGFLPIFSLIPQTVVSLQYLSPKMKFSWWRNKIS